MLREAGYRQRSDQRDLMWHDPENGVEFFYLRPRDIAVYVGSGDLDLGITGRDLLIDTGAAADEILTLDFARSTFRFAARPGTANGVRRLRRAADRLGVPRRRSQAPRRARRQADVTRLDGAVETAVRLGVADVIADVVETGATLRQAGWRSSASRFSSRKRC